MIVNENVNLLVDHFGIPLSREKEIKAAITTLADTEVRPLADYITKVSELLSPQIFTTLLCQVLNDTGRILRARMCNDLGEFILEHVFTTKEKPTAARLVEKLAATFPAMNDKATYKDKDVYIMKKAQILAGDLYRRFAAEDDRFNFPDISELTVFSDNVLPAVLRMVLYSQLFN